MFGYYSFNCYTDLNHKENEEKVEKKKDYSYLSIIPFVFSFKYKEFMDNEQRG